MKQHSRPDVVITGIGMATPLGPTAQITWDNAYKGQSGLTQPSLYYQQGTTSPAIGLVEGEGHLLAQIMSPKDQRNSDRFVQLALIAGKEALADAGILDDATVDRSSMGVYCGVGIGGLETTSQAVLDAAQSGFKRVSPFIIPRITANQAAGWLSKTFNLYGASLAVSTACSSGGDAIGLAFRAVRDGTTPFMLAGGAESCITPLSLAGFENMRALSSWAGDFRTSSRPFDAKRSGFVMGEGAGFVVLERADHALARGARIYATLDGYGAAADGYHVAGMHPEGRGPRLAITRALNDAGWEPEMVDYINAHGTGTPMNDLIEAAAIQAIFPHTVQKQDRAALLVSSTKSMMGHLLGAAGAVECGLTALSLYHNIVLPTLTCDEQDPAVHFDCVPHKARHVTITRALSHSFGFGGGCAVLALSKKNTRDS